MKAPFKNLKQKQSDMKRPQDTSRSLVMRSWTQVSPVPPYTDIFPKSLQRVPSSAATLMPTFDFQSNHEREYSIVLSPQACGGCYYSLEKLRQMSMQAKQGREWRYLTEGGGHDPP